MVAHGRGDEVSAARRWPLRASLAAALIALVASGLSMTRLGAKASVTTNGPTTSRTTTSTAHSPTSPVTTRTTATPTTTLVAPGLEAGSTAGPLVAYHAVRDCGLHQLNPVPVTTSSPLSPTTSVPTRERPTSSTFAPTSTRAAAGGTSTIASRPVRTTALRRCRILEVGDSIGAELGWGLQREIGSVPGLDLVTAALSSTGLAATWFYNWPAHLKHLLAKYRPNLVVVCLGANDQQGMSRSGHAVSFATMAWRDAYRGNIDQILGLARHAGAYVLWVGLPMMRPTSYNRGVTLLNSLYAEQVRQSPGAVFVSTSALLATPAGGYRASARVGSHVEVLRASDGVHFSVVGEDIVSTYVVKAIAASFHVLLVASHPMGING